MTCTDCHSLYPKLKRVGCHVLLYTWMPRATTETVIKHNVCVKDLCSVPRDMPPDGPGCCACDLLLSSTRGAKPDARVLRRVEGGTEGSAGCVSVELAGSCPRRGLLRVPRALRGPPLEGPGWDWCWELRGLRLNRVTAKSRGVLFVATARSRSCCNS